MIGDPFGIEMTPQTLESRGYENAAEFPKMQPTEMKAIHEVEEKMPNIGTSDMIAVMAEKERDSITVLLRWRVKSNTQR